MQYDRPKFGGIGKLVKMSKGYLSSSEMLSELMFFKRT